MDPPNVEGGSRREKLNTRKELSKATETGEKSRFFRGAPKTETTPTVRGKYKLPCQKFTLFVSLPKIRAEFTLSVAKSVALSETVPIFRKIPLLVLPLSNGVTGDRSTQTNDEISGCTCITACL